MAKLARGYDYLLSMKLWSLTMEKVEEIRAEKERKVGERVMERDSRKYIPYVLAAAACVCVWDRE